jgi:hypothetical protein
VVRVLAAQTMIYEVEQGRFPAATGTTDDNGAAWLVAQHVIYANFFVRAIVKIPIAGDRQLHIGIGAIVVNDFAELDEHWIVDRMAHIYPCAQR